MKIENDFYVSEQDEGGNWIIKAKPLELKKKKSEYKDPPRYKMIISYENEMKTSYHKMLGDLTKDVVNKLKEFVK